jgi:sRNA-binding regulator protein Hfq
MNLNKKDELLRIVFKIYPYAVPVIIGSLLCLIASYKKSWENLLIGMASTLFSIPFLYFFYEKLRIVSEQKLNKEIYKYVNQQVDRAIIPIRDQICHLVYDKHLHFAFHRPQDDNLSDLDTIAIEHHLVNKKHLGFQIFKKWDTDSEFLKDILKNPFILSKLKDEQIILLIQLIDDIRLLTDFQKCDDFFILLKEKDNSHTIINSNQFTNGSEYPYRYLLLSKTDKGQFIVDDFGDFYKDKENRLLHYFRIKSDSAYILADRIAKIIKDIDSWLKSTGGHFEIDLSVFKLEKERIMSNPEIVKEPKNR